MEEHKDFLATELLHELKLESERKDRQLGNLHARDFIEDADAKPLKVEKYFLS